MADDVIESLSLEISADAQKADKAIDEVVAKLEKLATSIGKVGKADISPMKNLTKSLEKLASSIGGVSMKGIDDAASSLQRFSEAARGLDRTLRSVSFDKTTQEVAGLNRILNNATKQVTSTFGIKSPEAIAETKDGVRSLLNEVHDLDTGVGSVNKLQAAMDSLGKTVKENARFFKETDKMYEDMLEYIRQTNASGEKVQLPFSPSEYTDDYRSMRATLGKAFTSEPNSGGIDLGVWIEGMNGEIGHVMDVEWVDADNFERLVDIVRRARDSIMSYSEAVQQGVIPQNAFKETIAPIMAEMQALDKEMKNVSDTAQETPLGNFAKSMQELSTIKAPNVGWMKTMADSVASLGNIDSANISRLVESLGKFDSLQLNTGRLQEFASALKKLDGIGLSNIGSLAGNIENAAKAFQGISGISAGAQQLTQMADAVKQFGSAMSNKAIANIPAMTSALGNLTSSISASMQTINGLTAAATNITAFANSIKQFGYAASTVAAANIPKISAGIGELASKLNAAFQGTGITTGAQELASLAASIKQFGYAASSAGIENIPKLASSLQTLMASIDKSFQNTTGLSEGAKQLTELGNSIKQFGYVASGRAIENIPKLGVALRQLMEELSKAPVVSRNVIDLANAIGNLARSGARTGTVANSMAKGLNSYSNSAKGATKNTKGLASVIGKLYATYWLLFRAFGKLGESIDIASQLTEVQNVVDVTFGNMEHKVEEFAETSIEQFGMSELTLKKMASRFQAMGNAMKIDTSSIEDANEFLNKQTGGYVGLSDSMADVSLNLTKLTADMASFYDVEQETMAEDMEAVFTGMTRPLRKYGLDLTQATLQEWALRNGLNADVQSMTQAEKTMLRYQYVMANTGAAQNDFARTSGRDKCAA